MIASIANDQLVATVSLEEALAPWAIQALAHGDVLAVVVHCFTDPICCCFISEQLVGDHRLAGYATDDGAADIKKLGMPLFEAAGGDPEKRKRYHTRALQTIRALRELSRPAPYPMDQLRLALQESWPAGADFENLGHGRNAFVGMPRVFEGGAAALPHVDRLAWDVPDVPAARTILAQIAANVHLRTAAGGGEVELWDMDPSAGDYQRLRQAGTYGLDRARLPAPAAVVVPQAGDLILFNSHRIHAVRACRGGPRVTVSCFIGYRGEDQPLSYWS
jgi:hypothetical protein